MLPIALFPRFVFWQILKKHSLEAGIATLLLSTKADTENATTSWGGGQVEPPAGSSSYFFPAIERYRLA